MTAGKLIQELSKHDPDSEVKFYLDAGFEAGAVGNSKDIIDVTYVDEVSLVGVSRPGAGGAAVILEYRD